ncbi:hypothetical protein SCP_0507580 [Sparassis crispa]|uniref:AC transposase n=1 Tax=Sparassis crispa TaxID=139825 RepID=A0A401GNC9_9APHY|nr:hypothetical protein SCP_0507580 [Sparassis crispa]GBE83702.1 hypothetical protein SCP_0507580 [Sparassis crispa]
MTSSRRGKQPAALKAQEIIDNQNPRKRRRKSETQKTSQRGRNSKRRRAENVDAHDEVSPASAVPRAEAMPRPEMSSQQLPPSVLSGPSVDGASGGSSTNGKTKRPLAPIHLFYTEILDNHQRHHMNWKPGDRLFQCRHGHDSKVLRVTKSMNGSTTGLKAHIKRVNEDLFLLLEILEWKHKHGEKPSVQELRVARGEVGITALGYDVHNSSAKTAPDQQSFDQGTYERIVAEWVAACDQPFSEVEKPEFKRMMQYSSHPSVTIPSTNTIKSKIMDIDDDVISDIKTMLATTSGKFSLALDCWTSNNWDLEEVMIDFREVIGEHSGENLVEVVWQTIKMYGLKGRIQAVIADNATNNDTLLVSLERHFTAKGIPFREKLAQLRCMPHTVHLAALELLDAIGASKTPNAANPHSRTKYQATPDNYQESVKEPLSSEMDNLLSQANDSATNPARSASENEETSLHMLVALDKLRKVVHVDHIKKALRSLPSGVPPQLKAGLLNAYKKLSDYHTFFDESPYYIWACLLDPCINYEGLRVEASKDKNVHNHEEYLSHIDTAKSKLKEQYLDYYLLDSHDSVVNQDISSGSHLPNTGAMRTPVASDFLTVYASEAERSPTEELDEYLKMKPLGFSPRASHPLKW